MNRFLRILIALAILLSGLALIPYIDLPSDGYAWQQFAGPYPYEPTPTPPPGAHTFHIPLILNN